jgi:hypothetical protein
MKTVTENEIEKWLEENEQYYPKVFKSYHFLVQIIFNFCQSVFEQGKDEKKPKIVCICGSGRFLKEMNEVEEKLTLQDKIVLMIGVNTKDVARTEDMSQYKSMLDELHLRKIDLSDEVFVVNVDGYIGESTRKEIIYAESIGKTIEYLVRETPGRTSQH